MPTHYVEKVLQTGEEIRYKATLNWILYLPGLAIWAAAAAVYILFSRLGWEAFGYYSALVLLAIGTWVLARAWFVWWTTEIAVTNRRIIYKTGFISRKTTEMHMDKVESVDVDQSVLGRICNFGDVIVRGTGTGLEPLRNVDSPIELRNHVTGVTTH